jgi:hypothetical protein
VNTHPPESSPPTPDDRDPIPPGSIPATDLDTNHTHATIRKDSHPMTIRPATTPLPTRPPLFTSSTAKTASVNTAPAHRPRVSRWAAIRVLLLMAVQIALIATVATEHIIAPTQTSATAVSAPTLTRAAFTQPLTPLHARGVGTAVDTPTAQVAPTSAVRAVTRTAGAGPVPAGSMTCAGRTLGHSGNGAGVSATGFNLNVIVENHDRASSPAAQGPLVVTCGDQGQLMILACAPLTGAGSDHAPAEWRRGPSWSTPHHRYQHSRYPRDSYDGSGYDGSGYDGDTYDRGGYGRAPAGWDQTGWREAWQRDWRDRGLSDDQLGVLNQIDPEQLRALLGQRYNSAGADSLGPLAIGGMNISLGGPISLRQPSTTYGTDPDSGAWDNPWSSDWNNSRDNNMAPDDLDEPSLIAAHHDSDHDSDRDDQSDGVCRWLGRR